MKIATRDGVNLSYEDNEADGPPMILVHGLGCNHEFLSPQTDFFSGSYRVVSVDLRGHGRSAAPQQDYTMTAYADDVAWLSNELRLVKPILVGHSMGGNVVLQFAKLYPDVAASAVLIDTVLFPSQAFLDALHPLVEALQGPDYLAALRKAFESLCLVTDRRTKELMAAVRAPQHVLVSALPNQLERFDSISAATGCTVPVAYIGAATPLADLDSFARYTPQLVVGRTLGSGHFSPIEVSDQINAMLTRFITTYPPNSAERLGIVTMGD